MRVDGADQISQMGYLVVADTAGFGHLADDLKRTESLVYVKSLNGGLEVGSEIGLTRKGSGLTLIWVMAD